MRPKLSDIADLTFDALAEHLRLASVNIEEYQEVTRAMNEEMEKRTATNSYRCMKCDHPRFELHEFRGTGGFFSSFFNVQTERYKAVVCKRCKFTELYHGVTNAGQQAADLILGS